MAQGEAMSRLDARFEAVWRRINDMELDKLYQPNARSLEPVVRNLVNTQNLLIAALVEAGILVEKKENSKEYLQIGDQKYTIRKVK
jgi:hypothetical protein